MLRCHSGLTPLIAATIMFRALPANGEPPREQAPREVITVTTNVVAPFFDVFPIEANLRLTNHFVLVLNGSHFSLSTGDWSSRINAAGLGVSYHFQASAPRRWYVEAIAELLLASWRNGEDPSDPAPLVMGSSLSALGGYRFIWETGPVLDLGLGIARVHVPSATAETESGPASSGQVTRYYPAPKVNLGWAF